MPSSVVYVLLSDSIILSREFAAAGESEEQLEGVLSFRDDELRERVVPYANQVRESTDRVDETLEHTTFGTFRAVSAAIGYDTAWQLYVARHLRKRHGEELSAEAAEALEELIETLELLSVAREHFKRKPRRIPRPTVGGVEADTRCH
ncbi:hypothetical protein [Natrialbaceae archaeon AArc-T1-2]|uniref:hypothetical protein n=1 Tax=Natrialbaceae archaeon AArc-T1-2 TaxID=3053904 RepID=UPI00255B163B|nr:hypothetical protein [Natrialbaceae archaeon AArc-T1-2]WIV68715.1 hypothetical protein QQ977_04565 [Natrialbaceae archaeon AArc-T1-2]